jgi:hypothetical protein
MASIAARPPDRVPASCLRRSFNIGKRAYTLSYQAVQVGLFRDVFRNPYFPSRRFSLTAEGGEYLLPSGTWSIPREDKLAGLIAGKDRRS